MGIDSTVQMPRAGDVIAGKYAIVRVIGEGGMGVVLEASHQRLRQSVAIKLLLPEMLKHPVIVTRFEREARAAAQLKSRHVARVMDVDVTTEGLPYMVMELLEGHDLQAELERRHQLPVEEAVDYVLQTCAAMTEAHALGIIHRDLKPSNLFLTNDGGQPILKVLDFGISKHADEGDAKLTGAEAVIGTALYMSPEQVRSSGTVDVRSDVWALGVVLFELLSGRPPWLGTPTQVAAAIVTEAPPDLRRYCALPEEIVHVIARALQRDPALRYPDVRELAYALAAFAPQGSAGRQFIESLAAGTNRPQQSFYPRPPAAPAPTPTGLTPAPMAHLGSGARDGGTAPGWTNATPKTRGRAAFIGVGVALLFAMALAGTVLLLKYRAAPLAEPKTASSVPPAAATAEPAADNHDNHAVPPTTASASVPLSTTTPPGKRPGTAPKPAGKPTAPPPSAAPTPPKDNPLTL